MRRKFTQNKYSFRRIHVTYWSDPFDINVCLMWYLIGSMNHSEYLVLQHFVILPACCPAECSVTCLSIAVLAVAVERTWKTRVTAVISIAFVRNRNVRTSEIRSVVWTVVSSVSIVGVGHLLFQVQRQQVSTVCAVICRPTVIAFPRVGSVGGDGFAELCANESESVRNAVAFLAELGSTEIVLRRSEQKLQSFGFVQGLSDEL